MKAGITPDGIMAKLLLAGNVPVFKINWLNFWKTSVEFSCSLIFYDRRFLEQDLLPFFTE